MFDKIGVCGSSFHDLRWDLVVDVEIYEAVELVDPSPKILLKWKEHLQFTDTHVLLPHPILIRHGFYYTICVEKFPDDHCCYSEELKTEVRPNSDIKIEFHLDDIGSDDDNEKSIDPIPILNFNRI